jgi:hypothetical protein
VVLSPEVAADVCLAHLDAAWMVQLPCSERKFQSHPLVQQGQLIDHSEGSTIEPRFHMIATLGPTRCT